jgi:hypothetical protein
VISRDGFCFHFDAECCNCLRMNEGSEIMARQGLLAALNRRRDLTGSRIRISRTIASGNSGKPVSVLLFIFFEG